MSFSTPILQWIANIIIPLMVLPAFGALLVVMVVNDSAGLMYGARLLTPCWNRLWPNNNERGEQRPQQEDLQGLDGASAISAESKLGSRGVELLILI